MDMDMDMDMHMHMDMDMDMGMEVEVDTVLFATGRFPVTKLLGLEKAGVRVNPENGKIVVGLNDATSQPHIFPSIVVGLNDATSQPHIFALGDVAENRPELTPAAIQAGHLLAKRLFGKSTALMDYNHVATTVFTPLEYACIGMTEEQLKASSLPSKEVYHAYFTPLDWAALDLHRDRCYAKALTTNGKIIGLHFLGPHAGEVMQGFAVAFKLGMTITDLQETVGIHPTTAEELTVPMVTKSSGMDPARTGC
eukprot:g17500.t1